MVNINEIAWNVRASQPLVDGWATKKSLNITVLTESPHTKTRCNVKIIRKDVQHYSGWELVARRIGCVLLTLTIVPWLIGCCDKDSFMIRLWSSKKDSRLIAEHPDDVKKPEPAAETTPPPPTPPAAEVLESVADSPALKILNRGRSSSASRINEEASSHRRRHSFGENPSKISAPLYDYEKKFFEFNLFSVFLKERIAELEKPGFRGDILPELASYGEKIAATLTEIEKLIKREKNNETLVSQFNGVKATYDELKNKLIRIGNESTSSLDFAKVHDIKTSDINACYIYSTLQPLLAVKGFVEMIPANLVKRADETDENFEDRKKILDALKTFVQVWNLREVDNIRASIGLLRTSIFESSFKGQLFVRNDDQSSTTDTLELYNILLEVLQLRHTTVSTKVPLTNDDKVAIINAADPAFIANGVFNLRVVGDTENANLTVQERVSIFGAGTLNTGVNWDGLHPDTMQNVKINKFREFEKIVIGSRAEAPQVLIVNTKSINYVGREGIFGVKVDAAKDSRINFAPIFTMVDEQPLEYELVAFTQNLRRNHWVSVVKEGDGWIYCDNAYRRPVDPKSAEFKEPAQFLVYQLKK